VRAEISGVGADLGGADVVPCLFQSAGGSVPVSQGQEDLDRQLRLLGLGREDRRLQGRPALFLGEVGDVLELDAEPGEQQLCRLVVSAEGRQDPGCLVIGAQADKGLAGGPLSAATLQGPSLGEPSFLAELRGIVAQV